MEIIDPIVTNDAKLLFCDLPEADPLAPEWDPLVDYVTGQRVSINTGGYHDIYECVWHTPNCLNKFPPDYLTGSTVYWVKVSATNRWKLFDHIVAPERAYAGKNNPGVKWGSGAKWPLGQNWIETGNSSITVSVKPGKKVDTTSLLNVDADSIMIVMTDPVAGEVYNEIKLLTTKVAANLVYSDLPNYPSATLEIIIRSATECYCGEIVIGTLKTIGTPKYGIEIGIVDFSVKSADEFGNFTILERAFSKRINVSFTTPLATHAGVMRVLEKYRSTPLVWIIDDEYSTTIAYGFYRDFQMSLPNNINAEGSISIEGLGADYIHATPIPDEWVPPWDGKIHLAASGLGSIINLQASKIEEAPVSEAKALTAISSLPSISLSVKAFASEGACTISHASPAVVTLAGNTLVEAQEVFFDTDGVLPAPLIEGTHYFVKNAGAAFNLSLTPGGSTIDTTTDGSGTHTLWAEQ